MIRLVLLILFSLISSVTLANPCKWVGTMSLASYHTDNKDYNEINLGLGIERWCSPRFFQAVAIYDNSYEKPSLVVGIGWTPIRFQNLNLVIARVKELKIGVMVGGVTGYEKDVTFAAGVYTGWKFSKKWGINVLYFPNPEKITRAGDGVYALQLKREF